MPRLPSLPRFQLGSDATRRLAFAFTLFLLAFEAYAIGVNYAGYYSQFLGEADGLSILAALTFIVISFCLVYKFLHAAFSGPAGFRVFYFSILSAAVAIEYSYQKALGRFSDVLDVTLALATTSTQKLSSLAMYFGLAAFVPCVVFLVLLIFTKGEGKANVRDLLLVNGLLVAVLVSGWTASISRFPSISIYTFYRTNVEFALSGPFATGKWGSKITGIELRRTPVTSRETRAEPANNIILVVDESVRGDHLSLNGYGRETTPLLTRLRDMGVLHNWGIAAASSTSSVSSYSALVTGLTPDDFPDPGERRTNTTPTMFQYAKAMGYKTWYFDGQMGEFWGGIDDDLNYIDHRIGVRELNDPTLKEWDIDKKLAGHVNSLVTSSTGNFVFIFKRGIHTPYHLNFPPEQTAWQPSYAPFHRYDIPDAERVGEIVNAYDNSIRYNVDSFFGSLIDDDYERIPNNTVILYTADHGQTLSAMGKASHGGESVAEAAVPLLIIGRLPEGPDTAFKASHSNILPTIVDLMGFPPENLALERKPESLLRAKAANSRPRYFNPQLGRKLPFD